MFWISFVIFIVTTVVYSIWASGEVQPWNNPEEYYRAKNNALNEAAHESMSSDKKEIQAEQAKHKE